MMTTTMQLILIALLLTVFAPSVHTVKQIGDACSRDTYRLPGFDGSPLRFNSPTQKRLSPVLNPLGTHACVLYTDEFQVQRAEVYKIIDSSNSTLIFVSPPRMHVSSCVLMEREALIFVNPVIYDNTEMMERTDIVVFTFSPTLFTNFISAIPDGAASSAWRKMVACTPDSPSRLLCMFTSYTVDELCPVMVSVPPPCIREDTDKGTWFYWVYWDNSRTFHSYIPDVTPAIPAFLLHNPITETVYASLITGATTQSAVYELSSVTPGQWTKLLAMDGELGIGIEAGGNRIDPENAARSDDIFFSSSHSHSGRTGSRIYLWTKSAYQSKMFPNAVLDTYINVSYIAFLTSGIMLVGNHDTGNVVEWVQCENCPMYSTSPPLAESISECTCNAGFARNGSQCLPASSSSSSSSSHSSSSSSSSTAHPATPAVANLTTPVANTHPPPPPSPSAPPSVVFIKYGDDPIPENIKDAMIASFILLLIVAISVCCYLSRFLWKIKKGCPIRQQHLADMTPTADLIVAPKSVGSVSSTMFVLDSWNRSNGSLRSNRSASVHADLGLATPRIKSGRRSFIPTDDLARSVNLGGAGQVLGKPIGREEITTMMMKQ